MFQRILVASDGSVNAEKGLARAVAVAKGAGTKVVGLVHVRPSLQSLAYAYGYDTTGLPGWHFAERLQEGVRQAEQRSRELLQEAEAYVRAQGLTDVEVVQHAVEGPVVRRIIDTVRQGGYDLLVIGSRGMGRAAGLLLGSVSQSVTANLPCSLLIVDAGTESDGEVGDDAGNEYVDRGDAVAHVDADVLESEEAGGRRGG